MELKKWISYWKKSLSDSCNTEINFRNYPNFWIHNFSFFEGQISNLSEANRLIDEEEKRINKSKGITQRDNPKWEEISETTVLIAPFVLEPITEHIVIGKLKHSIRPFWFAAHLNRNGILSDPEDVFPIFQRKFLTPKADDRTDFVFSEMEIVDTAVSVGYGEFQHYSDYLDYVKRVFDHVTSQNIEKYKVAHYATVNTATVILPDEKIGAVWAINQLYGSILDDVPNEGLLYDMIYPKHRSFKQPVAAKDFIQHDAEYLGQMGYGFPLSLSQRKALYSFYAKPQSVFAVNGPPGTGKTTLLQNVISNEMVKTAIAGGDPALILACSNNNQAVTNIIDSFSKSDTKPGKLEGRWLPNIEGYATFLPANRKTKEELTGLNYKKVSGEGLFAKIETPDYHKLALEYFTEKYEDFFGQKMQSLENAIERLRSEIIKTTNTIKSAAGIWAKYKAAEEYFIKDFFNSAQVTDDFTDNGIINFDRVKTEEKTLKEKETEVLSYYDEESFFNKICCLLGFKFALGKRKARLDIILRDTVVILGDTKDDLTEGSVLNAINKKIKSLKNIVGDLKAWRTWKTHNNVKGDPPANEKLYWDFEREKMENPMQSNYFFDELDVTLRHRAFQLALHYWEARWLKEAAVIPYENKGKSARMRQWKRHAMITPCFVSTFYMAPRFFNYSKHIGVFDGGGAMWADGRLYEFIDLLIVDEAGQVSPEIGMAAFSLAKKALIVGDTLQIEPIWNITKPVDLGNLRKTKLIKNYQDPIYDKFENNGFLSASGSLMKLAQHAAIFKEDNSVVNGIMLTEHRRCYNEIIAYCNTLAYGGVLKPLRGFAPKDSLFPPMQLIDVSGRSVVEYNSRGNVAEVTAIVSWLISNKTSIEKKYSISIENAVGIITPFKNQRKKLQFALNKAGFDTDTMKVGTVHALQGAERPIVLFSMVYTKGDAGVMFFDRSNKPNMLNVAVSRAKDSFIVFADAGILEVRKPTPSGLLASYLK